MLPDRWVGKIFEHMSAMYGAKFSDLWKGADMEAVRRMWAEKLSGFADKPEAIKSALDALDEKPFPPTLPEFLAMCRDAARRMGTAHAALPHHQTPEEAAKAAEAAKKARAAVSGMGDRDPLDWARHPRSPLAVQAVIATAKTDGRFREIVQELRDKGVIDDEGHALMVWNATDGQFQRNGWRQ